MGDWSKVPTLQIAASLETMAWQERKLLIDNALKKFDRALVGLTFQHSISVLENLRGLLGSYDLPVCLFSSLPLCMHFFLVFSPSILLRLSAWKLFTMILLIFLLTVWRSLLRSCISGVVFFQ